MKICISIFVIVLSWYLNAMSDAITFGKQPRTLRILWHVIKDISYALPFFWICYLVKMPWYFIIVTLILMCGWYLIYRFLRNINFWIYDEELDIPWLNWLWGLPKKE